MPGPTPKRSTERHGHRAKAEQEQVDTSTRGSAPVQWPNPDPDWPEIVRDWFTSIPESGQVAYFEPSDVAAARYVAEAMAQNLSASKFSAVLFAAVWSAMGDLLTTESARRRFRVELQKDEPEQDPEQAAAVSSLADARERFGAKRSG